MTKQQFYNGGMWRRLRDRYKKSKYYICERCNNANKTKRNKLEVHHKIPIKENLLTDADHLYNVALNPDNLELLCTTCHNMQRNSGYIAEGLMFDDDGNIIIVNNNLEW